MGTKQYSLWILKPRSHIKNEDDPWVPWYDKAFGFIVSARDEEEARRVANENGGDECGPVKQTVYRTGGNPWLDPKMSTCDPLKVNNKAEVVMRDFSAA